MVSNRAPTKNYEVEMSKFLLLPVENKSREFLAKLVLAALAVERGYDVLIGRMWFFEHNVDVLPKGFLLAKSFTSLQAARFQVPFKAAGFLVGATDEEGCNQVTAGKVTRRLSEAAAASSDLLFSWGENHSRIYRNHLPHHAEKICVAGNPRWDILRPEARGLYSERVEAIQRQYGKYLLVNTNFGSVNHVTGPDYLYKASAATGEFNPNNPEDREILDRTLRFEKETMQGFREMIPELASAFPSHSIIVRPHPSEDQSTWMNVLQRHENVHVVFEGDVESWIAGADALVINGCTTALQAMTMGTPVVDYIPYRDEVHLNYVLTNQVTPHHYEIAGLIEGIRTLVDDLEAAKPVRERALEQMAGHNAALTGQLAATRILDEIDRSMVSKSLNGQPHWPPGGSMNLKFPKMNQLSLTKFPDTPVQEVSEVLGRIVAVFGISAPDILIAMIAPSVFILRARVDPPFG